MVFLKRLNLLFIKAKKVAGTSVEIALSAYATDDDILTPFESRNCEFLRTTSGGRQPQNYSYTKSNSSVLKLAAVAYKRLIYKEHPIRFYNHINANDIRKRLGETNFDNAIKVAVVRNPLSTLVSLYGWAHRTQESKPKFTDWVKSHPEYWGLNNEFYFIGDQPIISEWIRFESIASDLESLDRRYDGLRDISKRLRSTFAKRGHGVEECVVDSLYQTIPEIKAEILKRNAYVAENFYPDI